MGWNRGRGDLKCLDKGLPFYTSPQRQSGSGPFHGARKCGGGNKPPLNSQQRTAAPLPHTALDREQMFFLRASLFRQQEVFFLSLHKGYSKCYRIKVVNAAWASALGTDASPPSWKASFACSVTPQHHPAFLGWALGARQTRPFRTLWSVTEVHNSCVQWLTLHEKVTSHLKRSDHQERIQVSVCCERALDKSDFKFRSPPPKTHPSTGQPGTMNPQATQLNILLLNSNIVRPF